MRYHMCAGVWRVRGPTGRGLRYMVAERAKMPAHHDGDSNTLLAFCSPFYEDVAVNELAALLDARPRPRIASGLLQFETDLDGGAVEDRLFRRPPIFTRQVVLNAAAADRTGDSGIDAACVLRHLGDALPSNIMVCDAAGRCPPSVRALRDRLPAAQVSGAAETSSAAVIATDDQLWVGRVLLGAGLRGTRSWPGARPDFGYEPLLVSRSALKLLEALTVFAVDPGKQGRALDLGASPGGWSQVLAAKGMTVSAVDPGALDPRVLATPGIFAHRATAQDFIATTRDRYRVIVDDMRVDARETARILVTAAANLERDGDIIVTLKLPEHRPSRNLRQALDILAQRYVVRARSLYYNRHEVTAHARLT
jgi:23S rRNA (cytidine2498-2'-O)-methyltransferase